MSGDTGRGLDHIIRAFGWSMAGLRAAVRHEEAIRIELFFFVILAPLSFWLGTGAVERVLLLGSLILVLIVELLNSAVEAVVDRISTDHHELSGRAKDIGSAAVFVALFNAGITWGVILLG